MTSLIRTPDKRLRVFVSSTLQELADERATTKEAIETIRLTPVMFETSARPHPPRHLYRAYLAQKRRLHRYLLAALWVDRAERLAMNLNYSNFKSEVARRHGSDWAEIYGHVWRDC